MLHCFYEGVGEPAGLRWAEVFGVYLAFSIARNAVIDFYRARRPTAELDETVPAPERDVELEALAEALEALSERERDVIVLHYYHGLTLKEVAVHMRLAYSTVKLCHNRTLERLQQMLAPEEATV